MCKIESFGTPEAEPGSPIGESKSFWRVQFIDFRFRASIGPEKAAKKYAIAKSALALGPPLLVF